ncbi:MAG: penicillin-binding protein 2 [Bacteroidales bacterium]|nr:penicillin-binding protein 2 [Bacteroidales bacterium]
MNYNHNFDNRRYFIAGAVIVIAFLFILRLFFLQVIDSDYKNFADNNAFLKKTIFPSRGLFYDRNNKLLVYNQPTYDIMVVTREVQSLDTLDFCQTLGISKEDFIARIEQIKDKKRNRNYSSYTPQVFMTQLTQQEYGALQEKLYRYTGFFIQNRTLREYMAPSAAHLYGSMAEVTQKDLDNDDYFTQGDYTGRSGIEKQYEEVIRGEKGYEILLRDAYGRIKGKYDNGKFDRKPIAGKNLKLTIDSELQQYGEMLMEGKLGSIVAIEPSTGEVLAMISAPSYNPSDMNGRERGKNYGALQRNPDKPLFDRPLMAAYPPGSTFKTTQALLMQQEGILSAGTSYPCNRGFAYGSHKLGCHEHPSPLDLPHSIQNSCNAYYCYALRNMLENRAKYPNIQTAFDTWKEYMVKMGFGYKTGIDLPGEKRGLIPNSTFYNKIYGERGWHAVTIISIAIGQGEVLATPLQICNLAATIANKGYYVTPHVVKAIQDTIVDKKYRTKNFTGIEPKYYDIVQEGMALAVTSGTATAAQLPGIEICGKTGTAQNPHGEDHSIFMSFAPRQNPKIAIAVYVENAGFGARYAAPIASLMIEKYLNRKIADNRKSKEEQLRKTIITPRGIKTYQLMDRIRLVDSTHVSVSGSDRVD